MLKSVITGDIIHSSRMDNERKTLLMNGLEDALKLWGKDFNMKSELYRGDSFQLLLHNVADSLRVALIVKTYIKSLYPKNPYPARLLVTPLFAFDARITIGIGTTEPGGKKLASSDGRAFQLSGRELDSIKNTRRSLGIATGDKYEDELKTEAVLLDVLLQRASPLQSEVVNLKLLGYTETEIAERVGVNQSAINQRSVNAGWLAIETAVKRFETIYK